jgi:hypothetical protein
MRCAPRCHKPYTIRRLMNFEKLNTVLPQTRLIDDRGDLAFNESVEIKVDGFTASLLYSKHAGGALRRSDPRRRTSFCEGRTELLTDTVQTFLENESLLPVTELAKTTLTYLEFNEFEK